MRNWILSVFAASLLSSLALILCPEGRVKGVTRMVCGLMCALAVASPLVQLDPDRLASGLAELRQQAQNITENGETEQKMLERTYIEEQCAAYISARAAEMGAPAGDVTVQARWDDGARLWYPWTAELTGPYRAALADRIEADLGIPAERQTGGGGDKADDEMAG